MIVLVRWKCHCNTMWRIQSLPWIAARVGRHRTTTGKRIEKDPQTERDRKTEQSRDMTDLNSQVNMCCFVFKASTSWSDGYHTPSCSTKQCWCSIYRDLLENSWLSKWSEAVPALWSWNSWCHRSSWGEKDTSSTSTTSSLNPDFNFNQFFFSPKECWVCCQDFISLFFQCFDWLPVCPHVHFECIVCCEWNRVWSRKWKQKSQQLQLKGFIDKIRKRTTAKKWIELQTKNH